MIFCQRHGLGFVHIPKAAGTTIRHAMLSMFPGACYHAPIDHNHLAACLIRDDVLGRDGFDRLHWFAVTRHPVHTIWSSWCRTRQVAEASNRQSYSAAYCEYLDRFLRYGSFADYARNEWINPHRHLLPGGLWRTYCCDHDGAPMPVRVLRFDQLAENWRIMCQEWDLPALALERRNASGIPYDPSGVPPDVYREIMDYCHLDCERFGYQ